MKKTLLTLLLLQSVLAVFGQKIHFTDNSNTWTVMVTYHNNANLITEFNTISYSGDTIVDSQSYKILGTYLVREDQLAKKVYVRYNDILHNLIDSEDRVLYNYNLHMDDTMHSQQYFGDYKSWVTHIDSTKINGSWHKVWHFTGYKYGGNGFSYYNVIEGIGCTNMFDYPVNTPQPDAAWQLVCFSTNGATPHLTKGVASFGMYYSNSLQFTNESNCPLGVDEVMATSHDAILYPNPVNENSRIALPYTMRAGRLDIINQVGQVIYGTELTNSAEAAIGNIINIPGVYLYRITDRETGKAFTGRFLY